jgi:hypothetical protein
MKKLFLGICLMLVSLGLRTEKIEAQKTPAVIPDWVTNVPRPNAEGIVFFRGYGRPSGSPSRSYQMAVNDARKALTDLIMDGTIPPLYPIPENAQSRSVFSMNGNDRNGRKVEITVSDIAVVARWEDPDGGLYVLCSCTGFEIQLELEEQSKQGQGE